MFSKFTRSKFSTKIIAAVSGIQSIRLWVPHGHGAHPRLRRRPQGAAYAPTLSDELLRAMP